MIGNITRIRESVSKLGRFVIPYSTEFGARNHAASKA
jgi:hypothetical protein